MTGRTQAEPGSGTTALAGAGGSAAGGQASATATAASTTATTTTSSRHSQYGVKEWNARLEEVKVDKRWAFESDFDLTPLF